MRTPPVDYDDLRSGFQSGRAAALSDWAFRKEQAQFEAVVNRLRVRKWVAANPEKRKANANRYAAKPDVKARQIANARRRRHARYQASNPVVACAECGVEFCPANPPRGGRPRKFCTTACMQRDRYQRITPGARRTRRTGGQPCSDFAAASDAE